MKKSVFFLVLLSVLFLISGGISMEKNEAFIGQTYEQVVAVLGTPTASLNTIYIWQNEDNSRFIGGFKNDGAEFRLAEYVQLSDSGTWICGTIPPEQRAGALLSLTHEERYQSEKTFDIGSGVTIPAVITADGYILFSSVWGSELFDCFNLEYRSILFYRIGECFGLNR